MSGKKKIILEELKEFGENIDHKKMEKLIEYFTIYHPKIEIDEVYKRSLRKTLLEAGVSQSRKSIHWNWYGMISLFGVLCTSFIAVFGIWNIFEYTSKPLPDNSSDPITPMALDMYIDDSSSIALNEVGNSTSSEDQKDDLEREIASIEADIMREVGNIGDTMNIESGLDIKPIESMAKVATPLIAAPESIDTYTPPPADPLPMAMMASDTSLRMNTRMAGEEATPSMSLTPPDYPSIMKLYIKPTPWTAAEIEARSGSGLIVREVTTEKVSVISPKIDALGKDVHLVSYRLNYAPLKKMTKEIEISYTLVPVIEYTDKNGHTYIISLVRGYK